MGIYLAHRMELNCIDDEDIELLDIYDPVYIYKVGDTFVANDVISESGNKISIGEFEVTAVKQAIEWSITGNSQIVICNVTKIGDGLVKDGK